MRIMRIFVSKRSQLAKASYKFRVNEFLMEEGEVIQSL